MLWSNLRLQCLTLNKIRKVARKPHMVKEKNEAYYVLCLKINVFSGSSHEDSSVQARKDQGLLSHPYNDPCGRITMRTWKMSYFWRYKLGLNCSRIPMELKKVVAPDHDDVTRKIQPIKFIRVACKSLIKSESS
uniref:(northern house mosquito) hypothetical protein n=1 Tax=Culex pipiens TaxID=7175 RepID=A0A8D8CG45_CULPI